MNGLPGRGLAALASAALWTGGAFAQSQNVPQVISPLRVETDHNNVNIVSGKTTIEPPSLSVPGAPNLRYDRVQNAAPYARGTVTGQGETVPIVNWSVHTGSGSSESFVCADWQDCSSVTGTGSTFRGSAGANASGVYRQAGSGAVWTFNRVSGSSGSVRQAYASGVAYPSGEAIGYTYDSAVVGIGQTIYRPTQIDSNMGYRITIAYQSGDPYDMGWGSPSVAAIYNVADLNTPLGRLTYNANGTITDLGGRIYACTGCSNALGTDLEIADGTMQLPGDSGPSLQVARLASGQPLVGSVVRDGVSYSYAYTYNGGAPLYQATTNSYLYTQLTVTGPSGFNQVYQLVQTGPSGQKRNVIASVTDSISRVSAFQFDPAYRPVQVNSPEGNAVRVLYDDRGNIVERRAYARPGTGLADIVETALYPDAPSGMPNMCTVMCWRPTWSRDALGRQTDYVYSANGQLTEQIDPADANGVRRRTSILYAASASGISRRSAVRVCADTGATCGTNSPIQTEYDYAVGDNRLLPSAERRIDIAQNLTLTTSYTYDLAGRLTSTDGPITVSDDTAYNRYDVHGRPAGTISADPDGAGALPRLAVRTSYDSADRPTRVETGTITSVPPDSVDPANWTGFTPNRTAETVYDSNGRKIREQMHEGGISGAVTTLTQYSYDAIGRLDCIAARMNMALFASPPASVCTPGTQGGDGPDRITRNVYDDAGQRLQLRGGVGTGDEGAEATWAYNANGQITTLIDGNGNRAELRYDGHMRQDRWTFPSATQPAAYDDSTPATALASAGSVNAADYEEYGYDAAGNRTSLRKRDGSVIGYSYDALNRLTGRDLPAGAWYNLDRSFGYDTFGRMVSAGGNGTIALSWDGFGRLTAETGPFGTVGYQYDAAGRRTRLTWPDGFYVTYDYFDNGALAHIRENGAATGPGVLATFTYDALGRRTRLDRGNGAATTYDYDGLSRLTGLGHAFIGGTGNVAWSFEHNPANGLRGAARDNDSYAWAGHYAVNRAYATNGRNQYTAAGATGFGYDPNGNLTSDGTRGFEYNAENRLTVGYIGAAHQELIDDSRDRLFRYYDGTANRWLIYDGTNLIAEVDGNGTVLRRYVHGLGEDEPLVWYEGAGTNDRHWLHADAQGSIVAISGASGASQINRYDEYGIPAATNAGRFQYTGQAWLAELGLYYYKARIYSPTLGRFLQTDPVGYQGGNNLYGYVGDDPINGTDPTGQFKCPVPTDCPIAERGIGQIRQAREYYRSGNGSRLARDASAARSLGGILSALGRRGEGEITIRTGDLTGEAGGGYDADTRTITLDTAQIERWGASIGQVLGHETQHDRQRAENLPRIPGEVRPIAIEHMIAVAPQGSVYELSSRRDYIHYRLTHDYCRDLSPEDCNSSVARAMDDELRKPF